MNPPPLLVSFDNFEQLLAAMPEQLVRRYGSQISGLADLKLPPIVSVRVLSLIFGYSTKFTGAIRKSPQNFYRTFKIPKGRGSRVINSPRVALKVIQK